MAKGEYNRFIVGKRMTNDYGNMMRIDQAAFWNFDWIDRIERDVEEAGEQSDGCEQRYFHRSAWRSSAHPIRE